MRLRGEEVSVRLDLVRLNVDWLQFITDICILVYHIGVSAVYKCKPWHLSKLLILCCHNFIQVCTERVDTLSVNSNRGLENLCCSHGSKFYYFWSRRTLSSCTRYLDLVHLQLLLDLEKRRHLILFSPIFIWLRLILCNLRLRPELTLWECSCKHALCVNRHQILIICLRLTGEIEIGTGCLSLWDLYASLALLSKGCAIRVRLRRPCSW